MNYIENVFICLAIPLFISIIFTRSTVRLVLTFMLSGMVVCLLSSYISTFLSGSLEIDSFTASLTLVPIVEELMKMVPLVLFILLFEPDVEILPCSVLMIAVGFATFENACYLAQNGAESFQHLLIRGFGTGAMHVVCGALVAIGLMLLWDKLWLRMAGALGLLVVATTFHGVYNILVSQKSSTAIIGYVIPMVTSVIVLIAERKLEKNSNLRQD